MTRDAAESEGLQSRLHELPEATELLTAGDMCFPGHDDESLQPQQGLRTGSQTSSYEPPLSSTKFVSKKWASGFRSSPETRPSLWDFSPWLLTFCPAFFSGRRAAERQNLQETPRSLGIFLILHLVVEGIHLRTSAFKGAGCRGVGSVELSYR